MNFVGDNSTVSDHDFDKNKYEDSERAHSFNLLKKTLVV